jgi:hypothetical protein
MQLSLMIELALMFLLVVKVGIRNAEQELRYKPFAANTPFERACGEIPDKRLTKNLNYRL